MSAKIQHRLSDGKIVLMALAGGLAAFAIFFMFISGGLVRQAEIFLPEKTYVTLAFRNLDGQVGVVGIEGLSQVNPTILMRIGDFQMDLTLVNQDTVPHSFYIGGLDLGTRNLEPGQSQTLTLSSEAEATYKYYVDGTEEPLGEVRAVKVGIYE
jgi:hypothetical protein